MTGRGLLAACRSLGGPRRRRVLERFLSFVPFVERVSVAHNGQEALDALAQNPRRPLFRTGPRAPRLGRLSVRPLRMSRLSTHSGQSERALDGVAGGLYPGQPAATEAQPRNRRLALRIKAVLMDWHMPVSGAGQTGDTPGRTLPSPPDADGVGPLSMQMSNQITNRSKRGGGGQGHGK